MKIYENALGLKSTDIEELEKQHLRTAFLPVGETTIELMEATRPDSVIARFIEKRGEGIHHICYDVDNIEGTLENLKLNNIKLINEKPVRGAKGGKIAFLHPKSTGSVLIELSEE